MLYERKIEGGGSGKTAVSTPVPLVEIAAVSRPRPLCAATAVRLLPGNYAQCMSPDDNRGCPMAVSVSHERYEEKRNRQQI
jgi:hypothetical protein